jgi:hypothetical protein
LSESWAPALLQWRVRGGQALRVARQLQSSRAPAPAAAPQVALGASSLPSGLAPPRHSAPGQPHGPVHADAGPGDGPAPGLPAGPVRPPLGHPAAAMLRAATLPDRHVPRSHSGFPTPRQGSGTSQFGGLSSEGPRGGWRVSGPAPPLHLWPCRDAPQQLPAAEVRPQPGLSTACSAPLALRACIPEGNQQGLVPRQPRAALLKVGDAARAPLAQTLVTWEAATGAFRATPLNLSARAWLYWPHRPSPRTGWWLGELMVLDPGARRDSPPTRNSHSHPLPYVVCGMIMWYVGNPFAAPTLPTLAASGCKPGHLKVACAPVHSSSGPCPDAPAPWRLSPGAPGGHVWLGVATAPQPAPVEPLLSAASSSASGFAATAAGPGARTPLPVAASLPPGAPSLALAAPGSTAATGPVAGGGPRAAVLGPHGGACAVMDDPNTVVVCVRDGQAFRGGQLVRWAGCALGTAPLPLGYARAPRI